MKFQLLAIAFGLSLLTGCPKAIMVEDIEPGRSIYRDCDTGAVIRADGHRFEECVGDSPKTEEGEEE